jgi:hypothetical protein
MGLFCLQISDDDERIALLDSPSTKTVVKNVFRHVTDVLQREITHSTAIVPELFVQIVFGLYGVDC